MQRAEVEGLTTSMLDRANAALVVIDVQERLAAVMEERDRVLDRTGFMIGVAAIVGVPIVATLQYPRGLGVLCESVEGALGDARREGLSVLTAEKLAFDCFAAPDFVTAIESSERKQLVICGMESHICVCQTALSALRAGYDVHVIEDACVSRVANAHAIGMERLARAGAVVTCAESAAYEFVGQAGTPEFKRLLGLVKQS
jgi:nicotinamidase-related amidase